MLGNKGKGARGIERKWDVEKVKGNDRRKEGEVRENYRSGIRGSEGK